MTANYIYSFIANSDGSGGLGGLAEPTSGFFAKHFPRKQMNFSARTAKVKIVLQIAWHVNGGELDGVNCVLCQRMSRRVVQIEPIVINQDIHIVRWLTEEPNAKRKKVYTKMNDFMIVIIEAAKWEIIVSPIDAVGWVRCTQPCHRPPQKRKWNARKVTSYNKSKYEAKKKTQQSREKKRIGGPQLEHTSLLNTSQSIRMFIVAGSRDPRR